MPTIILLMGIWINLTKNPMKPIMAKPMAVATAIFWNSINWRTFNQYILIIFIINDLAFFSIQLRLTFTIRFCASLHQTCWVFSKLANRIYYTFHMKIHCRSYKFEPATEQLILMLTRKQQILLMNRFSSASISVVDQKAAFKRHLVAHKRLTA